MKSQIKKQVSPTKEVSALRIVKNPSLEHHEFASIFPMLGEDALEMLAEDIKANGLRERIMLYEGKILDGRNRWKSCEKSGVVPQTKEFAGSRKDALDYVLSLNLHRRQMDESQRAISAAKFLKHSGNRFTVPQAKNIFSISESSIVAATRVVNTGHPSLIKDVEFGDMPVSLAKHLATLDLREQEKIFQQTDIRHRIKVARAIPKSPRRRLDTQQPDTKAKEIFDGEISTRFKEDEMKDLETAMYLTGETDKTSFAHQSIMRQVILIQRAHIIAEKAEVMFDGSETSPEAHREAKKKFKEALYDDTQGVETYFVLDREKRAKSNEERIAATAAYTFKKNEQLRKEASERENITRTIKENRDKESEANKKYTDAQIEKEARAKIAWEKEQDKKREAAKRKGEKFAERYNKWSVTKADHDDYVRENGMEEFEKVVDERVKEIKKNKR